MIYDKDIKLEQLTHENFHHALEIHREDIPEAFVDTAETIMEINEYGLEHGLIGHTFLASLDGVYFGIIMIGEAIPWDTDPEEMRTEPFYRIMGFVLDKEHRNKGLGRQVLEMAIEEVYKDFGKRSLMLGCHRENTAAARFYERQGFSRPGIYEGNDEYFLRSIK
ncbi:MAG: GNAT family N-acetyltransferase [Oscillospiraceae bacterium]|nr:GNAT family N-acetyltransferase [Oscillospiraceae bacterium]